MQVLNYKPFSEAVDKRFKELQSQGAEFFKVELTGDDLFNIYLDSFPVEANKVFRERRHYDSAFDKSYIRRLGNLVAITPDFKRHTIWEVEVEGYFQQVVDAMHQAVVSSPLKSVFKTKERNAGSKSNVDSINPDITWNHLYSEIPASLYHNKPDIQEVMGNLNTSITMFKRATAELTVDALETVSELIESDSIYRGGEFKTTVNDFLKVRKAFDKAKDQEAYVFFVGKTNPGLVRFRNTAIGTLITDLSNGMELNKAVGSFESKVAPTNYKRPTALVTPRMIEEAKETLAKEDLLDSLERRHATIEDLDIKNILFKSSPKKASLDVFDTLKEEAATVVNKKQFKKVEDISIEDFINKVLPTANTVEVLMESSLKPNLMSLITTSIPSAPTLFNWNNHYSWAYNGDVTDSIKERVKEAGGNVDAYFRVSLAWFNADDLDLALALPNGSVLYYRNKHSSNFELDLDMNGLDKHCDVAPVENIFARDKHAVKDGVYKVRIHNFSKRSNQRVGFTIQLEVDGQIVNYSYKDAYDDRQNILEITMKDGQISNIKVLLKGLEESGSDITSQDVWGIKTNTFVPLTALTLSPNHWDNAEGNKHYFFFLENCKTDDEVRGFYNEYLKPELTKHRKVFEILGAKTKVEATENQLGGLGFSSTQRNTVTVRVKGKTQRILNIKF